MGTPTKRKVEHTLGEVPVVQGTRTVPREGTRTAPRRTNTLFEDEQCEALKRETQKLQRSIQASIPHHQGKSVLHCLMQEGERRRDALLDKFLSSYATASLVGSNETLALSETVTDYDFQESRRFVALERRKFKENVGRAAAGSNGNFLIKMDGTLHSSGASDQGYLGRDGNEDKFERVTGMIPSQNAICASVGIENEDKCVTQVSTGDVHTVCVTTNQNAFFWGCYRNDGKFYRPVAPPDHPDQACEGNPSSIEGVHKVPRHLFMMPQKVASVSCGLEFTAFVLEDGNLVTMGMDLGGELGRGITEDQREWFEKKKHDGADKAQLDKKIQETFLTPRPVKYDVPLKKPFVISVSCGKCHMLVVVQDREGDSNFQSFVYAAGGNGTGQLGLGDKKNRNILTRVRDADDMLIGKVAAGEEHSLFLKMNGSAIYSCGKGDIGALGISDTVAPASHALRLQKLAWDVNEMDEDLNFQWISAGNDVSAAVSKTKKLYTWGNGGQYQLGDGKSGLQPRPTMVTKFLDGDKKKKQKAPKVIEAHCGSMHMLILSYDDDDDEDS